jgi:hypothetical protein
MLRNICSFVPTVVTAAFYVSSAMAQVPATIAATDGTRVATFQAEGAQIYECKIGRDGNLNWAVLRLNTHGGVAQGACDKAGVLLSVPYSATYIFLRKGD